MLETVYRQAKSLNAQNLNELENATSVSEFC
jgi:hypothetical protein